MRAALHYVRENVTKSPADLLDAAGLRALVAAVPEEQRVPEGDPPAPPAAGPDDTTRTPTRARLEDGTDPADGSRPRSPLTRGIVEA